MRCAAALGMLLAVCWPSEACGWAPKNRSPVKLPSRASSVPRPDSSAQPRGTSSRIDSVAAKWTGDRPQRRLQGTGIYDVGKYDRSYSAAAEHWDDDQRGMSAYQFDVPTHQGARTHRFGWDPLPQIRERDPNDLPSRAEMYPVLLDMNRETEMYELAAWYRRHQAEQIGEFDLEWCRRNAILPGQSGCAFEGDVHDDAEMFGGASEWNRHESILSALNNVARSSDSSSADGDGDYSAGEADSSGNGR